MAHRINHTVAYSATALKLHKDKSGKWVNSKGNRAKAVSYTKPKKTVKRKSRK